MAPTRTNRMRLLAAVAVLAASSLAAGCSSEDPDAGPSQAENVTIPKQQVDDKLRAELPADIREKGTLVSANSGSFPPYEIIETGTAPTGASAELLNAIGQLWGVKITQQTTDLASLLTGIGASRFDMAFGPVGDFKERQVSNDFVDYVQEFVVFAVPKGNPKGIGSIADTCGLKIAVQAGGSAEEVIKNQSKKCEQDGDPAVQVMSFKDQPQSILAVQSGRADAFFSSQAPLTYFVQQSNGKLQLAGVGEDNGFDTLYQGAVVPKGSPLGPVLQDTLQELFDNGTYAAIMKKWQLEDNMIDAPGMNRAVS